MKAPTAICVILFNILFVADAGIGKVLQLLVEECNLKLKAKASSLFTLPNGTSSIPTSLCYNANQLWSVDFSDNGGIYSFQFSESEFQSKVRNASKNVKEFMVLHLYHKVEYFLVTLMIIIIQQTIPYST